MDLIGSLLHESSIAGLQFRASGAEALARRAEQDGRHSERRILALELQTERLSLAVMALAEILRDEFHVTEEAIEAKLQEIDLRDGKLDGKVSPRAKQCPSCQRVNNRNRVTCMYCSAQLPAESLLFPDS